MMLVSLIVALVFENLVGAIRSRPVLWDGSPETMFFWAQCASMLVAPLTYWFTLSLSSSAVRTVFSPRDTIASILAAISFNILVAGIGSPNAVPWMLCFGFLFSTAWFAFRDYGRVYQNDPLVQGGVTTHRTSGRMMLAGSLIFISVAMLLHFAWIDLFVSSLALVAITVWNIVAHARWFGEWKAATGISSGIDMEA